MELAGNPKFPGNGGRVRPEGGVIPANSGKDDHRVVNAGFYFQCHVDKQIKLHLMVPTCGFGYLRVS